MDKPVKDYTIDDFRMKREELGEKGYRHYLGQLVINGDYSINGLSKQSGVSRNTIRKAINEIKNGITDDDSVYQRKPGGGRKPLYFHSPNFRDNLEKIIDGDDFFNPFKILHWTTLDLKAIQQLLYQEHGFITSCVTIANTLKSMGYQLTGQQKTLLHTDDVKNIKKQFINIEKTANVFMDNYLPVVCVHESDNDYVCTSNDPEETLESKSGLQQIDSDTHMYCYHSDLPCSELSRFPLCVWWSHVGLPNYPIADSVYIVYDKLWKKEDMHRKMRLLILFSELCRVNIQVSFMPPGIYKWDTIQHHMQYVEINSRMTYYSHYLQLVGSPCSSGTIKINSQPDENFLSEQYSLNPGKATIDYLAKWNARIIFNPI